MTETKTQTVVRSRTELDKALRRAQLPAQEENVLRMRYGVAASHDTVLEMRGESMPEVHAELQQIEQRVLQAMEQNVDAGRLGEIIARMRRM